MSEIVNPQRRIKSFVLRAGRTSPAQERALNTLYTTHGIVFSHQKIDPKSLFQTSKSIVFEIGFGMGDATAHIASQCPDINFIGAEVHAPGVGSLLNQIEARQLNNLKIIQHDAVEILEHMIPDNSLHGIHLFFPDPWHKKRHHKRRIVQAPFVAKLIEKLAPSGYIHFATDWEPYAHWMLEVLNTFPNQLENSSPNNTFAERPAYRPVTKFEARGLRLGHGVWDILFHKKG